MDTTDEEMCKKVQDMVYSDRRIQVGEIAQALGISHGSVSTILHDRLGMRKLTSRLDPQIPYRRANGSQSISMQRLVEAF